MKKLLIIIPAATVVILLLTATYFGLVPGLSSLFVKQIDLGTSYDPEIVKKLHEETGFVDKLDAASPTSKELEFSGEMEVKGEFTDDQIASYINDVAAKWTLAPYSNVQVKISETGEAQVSAMLSIPKAIERAKVLGYSQEQINTASKYIGMLPDEVPVYAIGTGKIENNQITINLTQGKIGNISVPTKYIEQVNDGLVTLANKKLAEFPMVKIRRLEAKDGKVALDGTFPQTMSAAE